MVLFTVMVSSGCPLASPVHRDKCCHITVKYRFYQLKAPPADPCKVFPKNSWHLKKSQPTFRNQSSFTAAELRFCRARDALCLPSPWHQRPSRALLRRRSGRQCSACGRLLGGQKGSTPSLPLALRLPLTLLLFTARALALPSEPLFPRCIPALRQVLRVPPHRLPCGTQVRTCITALLPPPALLADVLVLPDVSLCGEFSPGGLEVLLVIWPFPPTPSPPVCLTCLYVPGIQTQILQSPCPHTQMILCPSVSVHVNRYLKMYCSNLRVFILCLEFLCVY